jgi:hypothetical protein
MRHLSKTTWRRPGKDHVEWVRAVFFHKTNSIFQTL